MLRRNGSVTLDTHLYSLFHLFPHFFFFRLSPRYNFYRGGKKTDALRQSGRVRDWLRVTIWRGGCCRWGTFFKKEKSANQLINGASLQSNTFMRWNAITTHEQSRKKLIGTWKLCLQYFLLCFHEICISMCEFGVNFFTGSFNLDTRTSVFVC